MAFGHWVFQRSLTESPVILWGLPAVKSFLDSISNFPVDGLKTRYSRLDATLGLAFAQTSILYPFFGTLLGWIGVALTGSDTASNALCGSLKCISSEQLGLTPALMGAANSSGGVMGKMIDAQRIVGATTELPRAGRRHPPLPLPAIDRAR